MDVIEYVMYKYVSFNLFKDSISHRQWNNHKIKARAERVYVCADHLAPVGEGGRAMGRGSRRVVALAVLGRVRYLKPLSRVAPR